MNTANGEKIVIKHEGPTSSPDGWGWMDNVRLRITSLLLGMARSVKPKSHKSLPIESDSIQHWFPLLSPEFVAFLQEKGFSHLSVYTVIERLNDTKKTPYSPPEAHKKGIVLGEERLRRIQEVLEDGSYVSPGNTNIAKFLPQLLSRIGGEGEVQGAILDLFKHSPTIADLYILGSDGIQDILAQVPEQYGSILKFLIEQLLHSFSYIGMSNGEEPEGALASGTQDTLPRTAPITNTYHHYPQKPSFSRIRAVVYGSVLFLLAWERGYINTDTDNVWRDTNHIGTAVLRILDHERPNKQTLVMPGTPDADSSELSPEDDTTPPQPDAGDVSPDNDLPYPPEESE